MCLRDASSPDNRPASPGLIANRQTKIEVLQWRAGQSSGQSCKQRRLCTNTPGLQWRAGQSSGQSCRDRLHSQRGIVPSMEGRTIVRPVTSPGSCSRRASGSFNGGPDNRPASLARPLQRARVLVALQWRAGQSSGQSPVNAALPTQVISLQWRAGQSSGQSPLKTDWEPLRKRPSMEGRTIVRPVA